MINRIVYLAQFNDPLTSTPKTFVVVSYRAARMLRDGVPDQHCIDRDVMLKADLICLLPELKGQPFSKMVNTGVLKCRDTRDCRTEAVKEQDLVNWVRAGKPARGNDSYPNHYPLAVL